MLHEAVAKVFRDEVSALEVHQLEKYARKNTPVLGLLYDTGIIHEQDFNDALQGPVTRRIHHDYRSIRNTAQVAESLVRPQILAYGIVHGVLTSRQVKGIRFENRGGYRGFCETYRAYDLLDDMRTMMLYPSNRASLEEQIDFLNYSRYKPSIAERIIDTCLRFTFLGW